MIYLLEKMSMSKANNYKKYQKNHPKVLLSSKTKKAIKAEKNPLFTAVVEL